MFFLSYGLGNHVVYVDFDFSVHHVVEQSHHSPLIGYPDVLEPKGHHLIAERSPLWVYFMVLLVIALVLECSILSPQEEDLHMVLEFLLEMVQDKQVTWSWSLQSIMASIYEISP